MINYLRTCIRYHIKDERGQGMVEYGLILALIAIVVIVAVTGIGTQLKANFENIATKLTPTT